jgi:chromosome segregation ATPase
LESTIVQDTMSNNNNEEDLYNDEYSEGEQEFNRAETPAGEDEQHTQKVNGKIESMQTTIDNLTAALNAATQKNQMLVESQTLIEQENSKLRDMAAECGSLKKKNNQLKEQLDSALSLNCGGSVVSEAPSKSGKLNKSGSATGSALDGGASQTSLFSNTDSMASKRIKQLEHELRLSSTSTTDIQSLRAKIIQMNERIRIEKEYKYRAEGDVQACQKKIDMLSSHMEKLVIHLKHEGAHKLRLAEQLRVSERSNAELAEKCDFISRKSAAKDRLILELREGSKVLEDQLRLMDEKYMELRTKLDYARELGVKKIKKAEKVASDLRIKFALSNNSAILDHVPLPMDPLYGGDSQWSQSHAPPLMTVDQPTPYMRQSASPLSRGRMAGGKQQVGFATSSSMTSLGGQSREPTMDGVLEKIRKQEGRKQEWTEEKLNKLVKRK